MHIQRQGDGLVDSRVALVFSSVKYFVRHACLLYTKKKLLSKTTPASNLVDWVLSILTSKTMLRDCVPCTCCGKATSHYYLNFVVPAPFAQNSDQTLSEEQVSWWLTPLNKSRVVTE